MHERVVIADSAMVQIFELAGRLAEVDTTVLILGETGVGKEAVAQEIHRGSSRAVGPFVRLNCSAFPATLLESELFGRERGAFTGADRRQTGYLEAAHGGTLFLDEVGELPPSAQVKLLSVLENREVHRLGATRGQPIDVSRRSSKGSSAPIFTIGCARSRWSFPRSESGAPRSASSPISSRKTARIARGGPSRSSTRKRSLC